MAIYGLTSYDKCKILMEIFKRDKLTEITQDELNIYIAKNIGSSIKTKTIVNYVSLLVGLKMIVPAETSGKYKICYEALNG